MKEENNEIVSAAETISVDYEEKLQRSVALLPWSHNILILSKDLNDSATLYYAQESVAKGWNRDLLLNALKLKMHETHALVSTDNNFSSTLPATQAQYANEVFRSSYNLGFLGVTEPILELELERRLVEKIKLFLLELGKGFTFIGNQHVLEYYASNGFKELGTDKLKTFINIKFNSMRDAKERLQMSVADIRNHYFELQRRLYGA